MHQVEILLATYNGEKYLREQLDSILAQEYENWIVRACDDASKDSTYEILQEYQKQYPDRFIIERRTKGYGSAKLNFMNLIKKSTADYVMCCDQDDVWLPHKISVTLEKMKECEDGNTPVLVHTDLKVVDDKLNIKSNSFFDYSKLKKDLGFCDLLIQNSITGCTTMLNRPLVDLLDKELNYDKILMHDWVAAVVAIGLGKIGFVDEPTMLYRQHSVNSVGAKQYGISLFWSKIRNSDLRASLKSTMVQAGEIAEAYRKELPQELYELAIEYATIYEKSKLYRVRFYIKNKILKNGLPRQVCQIIFG